MTCISIINKEHRHFQSNHFMILLSWCVLFNHEHLTFSKRLSISSTCPPTSNLAVVCVVSKAEPGHSKIFIAITSINHIFLITNRPLQVAIITTEYTSFLANLHNFFETN